MADQAQQAVDYSRGGTARVKLPNGRVINVEVPPGLDERQAQDLIRRAISNTGQVEPPPMLDTPDGGRRVHPGDDTPFLMPGPEAGLPADFPAVNPNPSSPNHTPVPERDPPNAQPQRPPPQTPEQAAVQQEQEALDWVDRFVAAGDLGLMVASGAAADIPAGLFGLAEFVFSGGDSEVAANTVDAISEALTWTPRSKGAKRALSAVMPAMAKFDRGVSDVALAASFGNPEVATAIKTALYGAPEVLGFKAARMVRKSDKLRALENMAEAHGVDMSSRRMQESVIDAANKMTPEVRASHAGDLQKAWVEAHEASKQRYKALYKVAKETDTFLELGAVEDLGIKIENHLISKDFDIATMDKTVLRRLDELRDIRTKVVGGREQLARPDNAMSLHIKELERIRRRATQDRGATKSEKAANAAIARQIDDFIEAEFDKLVLGEKKGMMSNNITDAGNIRLNTDSAFIGGKARGATAAVEARRAFQDHLKRFDADKVLTKWVAKETTPEQIRDWLGRICCGR